MVTAGDEREVGQLYSFARTVLNPLRKFFYRIDVDGLENVPVTGPAIMCPNHVSFLDSPFLMLVLPRRITYVGKAEYMDDWKTKYLFPAVGMIPIDRSGGNASERALNAATRVLERGELFGIFPEGTRSRDGILHKGHTGPARLAFRTGAPIVPVGVVGTERIQPPDAKLPRAFMSCAIRFGRPIAAGKYGSGEGDRLALRQVIDEVMYEIRELTDQQYVDEYATKQAEGIATDTAKIPSGTNGDRPDPPRRSSADVLGGPTRATG
jgi:1-acyl-sn-glycerol-3-phosphate acyltransferase